MSTHYSLRGVLSGEVLVEYIFLQVLCSLVLISHFLSMALRSANNADQGLHRKLWGGLVSTSRLLLTLPDLTRDPLKSVSKVFRKYILQF